MSLPKEKLTHHQPFKKTVIECVSRDEKNKIQPKIAVVRRDGEKYF